jgi:hypothetical protein
MELCADTARTDELRASYLVLAQQWRELADQVEAADPMARSDRSIVTVAIRH